jgi:hypothetical protein
MLERIKWVLDNAGMTPEDAAALVPLVAPPAGGHLRLPVGTSPPLWRYLSTHFVSLASLATLVHGRRAVSAWPSRRRPTSVDRRGL